MNLFKFLRKIAREAGDAGEEGLVTVMTEVPERTR